MAYNVAVVGATGNVGRKIVEWLALKEFAVNKLGLFASERSKGKQIAFHEDLLTVEPIDALMPEEYDIFFFAAGSSVSQSHAQACAQHGVVIDKSSLYRMEENVQLIVPEVNSNALQYYYESNIIASPNCVAIPVSLVLNPLRNISEIASVQITSLQSVSGAGKAASDDLYHTTRAIYMGERKASQCFPKDIAFNLIPQIGAIKDNGYTDEENKIREELAKILNLTHETLIDVTCVRAPVFVGHSQVLHIEFQDEIDVYEALAVLDKAPSVSVITDDIVTPIEAKSREDVLVCRVRTHPENKKILNLWAVSDNLVKGAALNAVQIAEHLVREYL